MECTCENKEFKSSWGEFIIVSNYIRYSSTFVNETVTDSIKINFCPICGGKLKEIK